MSTAVSWMMVEAGSIQFNGAVRHSCFFYFFFLFFNLRVGVASMMKSKETEKRGAKRRRKKRPRNPLCGLPSRAFGNEEKAGNPTAGLEPLVLCWAVMRPASSFLETRRIVLVIGDRARHDPLWSVARTYVVSVCLSSPIPELVMRWSRNRRQAIL